MRRLFLPGLALFFALLLGVPPGAAQRAPARRKPARAAGVPTAARLEPPSAAHGNADAITAAQLREYLTFIASDEMEGRDTPSRGLDTTAKFIAMNLERWGFKPAGDDGTFFQRIALQRSQLDPEKCSAEIENQKFTYGQDFLAGGDRRMAVAGGTASGSCVYVGTGYVLAAQNIDPYAGLDVRDKILVVTGGLPKGVTFRSLQGEEGKDWDSPTGYAARHGARGVIVLPSFSTLNQWNQLRQNAVTQGRYQVARFNEGGPARVPSITISLAMFEALFRGEKQGAAELFSSILRGEPGESFALSANRTVSFTAGVKTETASTQNVVAVLEGSDPALKNEYVAMGAHYDHLGIGRPVNGHAIYNGADDDGSGTTAILAMAEAFAHGPRPKRSLLFVWHCGEEKGLWGSTYFSRFPTVPLDHVVAQLNIDMIGRSRLPDDTNPANGSLSGPNEIYVIGSKMMSTDLGELSERVNKGYLNLNFNYRYDDPRDPNGFFFRSDHYNYARKGIPIIFYFDGVHADYHRPSDTVEKIDFAKMEKVTRTVFATAWELANQPHRPKVDKQLPGELSGGRRGR
jgi:hypothetical protein